AVGSAASGPAIAASRAARSPTRRAIGPMQSSVSARGNTPKRETRPHVGFRPATPHQNDGMRIEPAVSLPSAPKQSPAAVAAPEPLEEDPGERSKSHGFRGGSIAGWWTTLAPSVI